MTKEMFSKILAIGVILLFIGVGIQPAFAVELKLSTDKTEKAEDCECQEVNRADPFMVLLWLDKLEVFTNIILSKFGHIPEVEEDCYDMFNIINSYDPLSNGEVVCAIIIGFYSVISSIYNSIKELQEKLIERYPIIGNLLAGFLYIPLLPIMVIHYFLETFISIFCS